MGLLQYICILCCSESEMCSALSKTATIYLSRLHRGLEDCISRCQVVCCVGTRCPDTKLLSPCTCFVPTKRASPCLKGFPPAETVPGVPSATWHSLEQLKQPIQTPKAVMSRDNHIYTICAPVLTWFFQVKHGSPVTEPVALQELQ